MAACGLAGGRRDEREGQRWDLDSGGHSLRDSPPNPVQRGTVSFFFFLIRRPRHLPHLGGNHMEMIILPFFYRASLSIPDYTVLN